MRLQLLLDFSSNIFIDILWNYDKIKEIVKYKEDENSLKEYILENNDNLQKNGARQS